MEIAVGELEVIAYVPVNCPAHTRGWDLRVLPVAECAYCRCITNCDQRIYDDYMDVVVLRHPNEKTKRTWEWHKGLIEGIESDGRYIPEKTLWSTEPIEIYAGTKWLKDGHHRCAIIYALFGPEYRLMVHESSKPLPIDLNECSNPCKS